MRLSFQSHKIHIYLYSPLDSDFHVTQRWVTKRQTGFEVMASSLWTGGSLLQRRTNSGSKTLHSVMLRYFPLPAFLERFSKGDFTSGKTHKLSQIKTVLSVMLTVSDLSLLTHERIFHFISPPLHPPSFWRGEWMSRWIPGSWSLPTYHISITMTVVQRGFRRSSLVLEKKNKN